MINRLIIFALNYIFSTPGEFSISRCLLITMTQASVIAKLQTTKEKRKMFSAMILALSFTLVCPAIGEDDEKNYTSKSLKMAWTEKPPYAFTSKTTEDKFMGLIREAIWQYLVDCGKARGISYQINASEFGTELKMVESLRNNQVHIAAPIFELTNNRTYSEFPFLELDHYPGTEYITNEEQINALSVVLDAVMRSWPLFAVTLVLTAIAGIVMWALVGFFIIYPRKELPHKSEGDARRKIQIKPLREINVGVAQA